ncbi:MAG: hypothetical protein Ct9H300mP1_00120 [Planctomycetaceae bacterium]|nr:MAG: hypothetical protein Ct9H300mP1_00120 [Planctomycetaceae bacterium]
MVKNEFHAGSSITSTPGQRRVVALVGPTGVGKTTTIAKRARQPELRDGVRMGLVTVDTYRIAAVEQLRTYAEIIDLPMKVVTTPMEMRRALDELSDMDLVLIEPPAAAPATNSRSGNSRACWPTPRATRCTWCSASPPISTTSFNRQPLLDGRHLVAGLTKLDETHELGVMLNLARRSTCRSAT